MTKHYDISSHYHFLTFSCYQRRWLFQTDELYQLFITHLDNARHRMGFKLAAFVVLPNHVHLMLQPQPGSTITDILRGVKRSFSYHAHELIRKSLPEIESRAMTHTGSRFASKPGHPSNQSIPKPKHPAVNASSKAPVWRFWQAGCGYDRNIFSDKEFREKVDYIHNNPVKMKLVDDPAEWKWSSARFWMHGELKPLRMDVPEI